MKNTIYWIVGITMVVFLALLLVVIFSPKIEPEFKNKDVPIEKQFTPTQDDYCLNNPCKG